MPSLRNDSPANQFEVDLRSGKFVIRQTDLFISDAIPLALTRTYQSFDEQARSFGVGTSHPYDVCPVGTRNPYTYIDLILEDGTPIHFNRISKGTGYADAVYDHTATSSEFYGARINWNGNGWTLLTDSRSFVFPEAYNAKSLAQGAATEMHDAAGHRIELIRSRDGNLRELVSSSGHRIVFTHDAEGHIIEARDDFGRVRKYGYDAAGRLRSVADDSGLQYEFGYNGHLMTTISDGNGRNLLTNVYELGRISEQRLSTGKRYRYRYQFDAGQNLIRTTIVESDGQIRRFFFLRPHCLGIRQNLGRTAP